MFKWRRNNSNEKFCYFVKDTRLFWLFWRFQRKDHVTKAQCDLTLFKKVFTIETMHVWTRTNNSCHVVLLCHFNRDSTICCESFGSCHSSAASCLVTKAAFHQVNFAVFNSVAVFRMNRSTWLQSNQRVEKKSWIKWFFLSSFLTSLVYTT